MLYLLIKQKMRLDNHMKGGGNRQNYDFMTQIDKKLTPIKFNKQKPVNLCVQSEAFLTY